MKAECISYAFRRPPRGRGRGVFLALDLAKAWGRRRIGRGSRPVKLEGQIDSLNRAEGQAAGSASAWLIDRLR
jgi:hypothetical protein